jgi:hypothetical protein
VQDSLPLNEVVLHTNRKDEDWSCLRADVTLALDHFCTDAATANAAVDSAAFVR